VLCFYYNINVGEKPMKNRTKVKSIAIALSLFLITLFIFEIFIKENSISKPELISITNRHLIGREVITNGATVYTKDDQSGKEPILHSMPDNSIIIDSEEFIPVAISQFKTTKENDRYITPKIIFNNGSVAVFTKPDGSGWELEKGDSIIYSFEKYLVDFSETQSMAVGYIKNNTMTKGNIYENRTGKYTEEIQETGEYYLYIANFSSENIALKEGSITFNTNR